MGQRPSQHPQRNDDPTPEREALLKESGVVPTSMVDQVRRLRHLEQWPQKEAPPWSVIDQYLTHGDDYAGIEARARRSKAFAYVLQVMRSQEEDALLEEEGEDCQTGSTVDPARL